ncbi:hypothetical protein BMI86_13870 [Thioclava sp. DLFJ5-1]|uniref:hypothetical protein n=1 Tax=Thioclava sp. DLFJ5-1 TaxID=1915314 RepID=UPI000996A9CA|nr:hypothetical protein [Thioclava sp. DLFJ5-1]OOY19710.1 hypothetical protein BMI86_13870 [Thioclava sp. DLFJ5-1]
MPINIQIEDADLDGFSDPAKESVKTAGEEFIRHVIKEANRLESAQNAGNGPVEITKAMVDNAALIQRHAVGGKKTPTHIKLLRIASSVLSLLVGIMYDTTKLQQNSYMATFVIVIALAILATTLSTLKE